MVIGWAWAHEQKVETIPGAWLRSVASLSVPAFVVELDFVEVVEDLVDKLCPLLTRLR